jgi:hypothetical protein
MLHSYPDRCGDNFGDLVDVLTDVVHWGQAVDEDFKLAVAMATDHYDHEKRGPRRSKRCTDPGRRRGASSSGSTDISQPKRKAVMSPASLTQLQREIIDDLEDMHREREDISDDDLKRAIEYVKDNPDRYEDWESTWEAAKDVLART